MRGKKGSPYEGGHRVPFLIRFPDGRISGGRDMEALTSYVDFMPTLLELCGVDIPSGRGFHGRSLASMLRGGDPPADWAERVNFCDTQRTAYPVKWHKSAVMKQKWRLINGSELYDLGSDPGQRHDIAADYPDTVAVLRRAYEAWWKLISEQFDRDEPIALGQDSTTAKLTTHDIRNEACDAVWNQCQVRAGQVTSGYWAVDVKEKGRYEIELRRWPEETGYALTTGINGDDSDCIKPEDAPAYEGGPPIAIRSARLAIGGQGHQCETDPQDTCACFEAVLKPGTDRLYASFHDDVERTIAPYYVYVRKL